jgi:diguanylate cyclase (GGDEF)-like protein
MRSVFVSILLLACELYAALAWWLVRGANPDFALPIATLLALLPAAVCVGLLLRLDRVMAHSQAVLDHGAGETQAQEQTLDTVRRERDLLVAAFDNLPIGVAVFDQHDRRVWSNRFLDSLIPSGPQGPPRHASHQDMLHREREIGVQPFAAQTPPPFGAGQDGTRTSPHDHAVLLHYPGDRWIQGLVAGSESGITVVARADVTELVRAQLQANEANEKLVQQSATDGLTGITNRRRFDETLGVEWLRAARVGNCLSLLMVDIDYFKRFNDHYGHVAGDECLRQVAQLLQACVRRAGELVARYGGEEFVVLLPGAEVGHAEELARRCLEGIAKMALPHASSPTAGHVTFSIGIGHVYPSAGHDPASLVNAADTAMYRAKTAGRARYEVAGLADWEIDKDAARSRPAELN